jgi:hypothetical protein
MRRWSPDVSRAAVAAGAGLALLAATLPPLEAAPPKATAPAASALARLTYVERRVEQGIGTTLGAAAENGSLRFGETIRTAADGMARLDFAWMSLTLSPSSVLSFPDDLVLEARLDQGRVVVQSGRREILKLVTPEAEVRGTGRAVVRRGPDTTLLSCVDGKFLLSGGGRTLAVPAGKGALVRAGKAPEGPLDLPAAPSGLAPGADPVYVAAESPVALRWAPRGKAYSVELLPVGADTVLMQRDAGAPEVNLEIAWPGAFRWRVAARDERGLEGLPSGDGQLVVEER